jgi:mRNA interferase HigB
LPGNEHMQSYLNEWYHFCSKKIWNTPQDVKNTLRNASIIEIFYSPNLNQ